MKYLLLNDKNKTKKVVNYLISKYSLPKIQRRLDIFVEDDDFRIVILDNKISFRKNDRLKTIYIKNKNLKYYFKSLDNTKKYYINEISILSFKNCSLLFDTYHGTILSVDDEKLYKLKN